MLIFFFFSPFADAFATPLFAMPLRSFFRHTVTPHLFHAAIFVFHAFARYYAIY